MPARGPLGSYGIARSLVQTPGWKPLEAEQNEMLPQGGGGGGGFGFSMGPQQRGYNDMEKTILAHNYPGGFKVATDQYAAKNSEQLDAWAKEELKQKYPGKDWDAEFARQAAEKDKYQMTKMLTGKENLWGPLGPVKKLTVNRPSRPINYTPAVEKAYAKDRSGLNVFNRARQNRKAIARRPTSPAAAYTNFGRFG